MRLNHPWWAKPTLPGWKWNLANGVLLALLLLALLLEIKPFRRRSVVTAAAAGAAAVGVVVGKPILGSGTPQTVGSLRFSNEPLEKLKMREAIRGPHEFTFSPFVRSLLTNRAGPQLYPQGVSEMLTDPEKRNLLTRLRRVEGQVAGVGRMVERGDYCVDVLLQIAAARAALGRVGRLVLESHVNSCVCDAMSNGDAATREKTLRELIDVFEQFADLKRK